MPHKAGRRGPGIAGLVLAAAGALIWTAILLQSQNTLLRNGNWISAKRQLQTGVMGCDSFLITRAALSGNRLNLGSWFGSNEVLYKTPLRPREFRFGLTLEDKAVVSVLFPEEAVDHRPGVVSGLRLSRDPSRGAMFFESEPSGRFISKTGLDSFPLDGRRHLVSLRFEGGRVKVSLDGREIASRDADTERIRSLGWRSGAGQSFIRDVFIADASGEVFRDSFRNTRHWRRILLLHAALFLLLLGAASWIPSLNGAGLLLCLSTVGLLWLGIDNAFLYRLPLDGRIRPFSMPQAYRIPWYFESLRYEAFENWNKLLTGDDPLTVHDVIEQGYPRIRLQNDAIYCSSDSACVQEPASLLPPRNGSYRILLIGTSQARGSGAARLDDTFFVQLHRRLARHFRGRLAIESLNMSMSGSNAPALLADDRDNYSGYRPDLVLISLGSNGAPDSLRSGLSDLLALDRAQGIKTILLKEANTTADALRRRLKLGIIQQLGEEFQAPVWNLDGFLRDPKISDSGFLWWDGYHLTSYGQTLVSDWLSPQVIAFIEEDRRKAAPAAGYEVAVKLGSTLLNEGDDAGAQAAFAKALAFRSRDYRAEAGSARIAEDLGHWDQAAELYRQAREKAPGDYGLCMKLAHAYVQMGRLDLAKQTFAQAKSLDPKQADAYIAEGYAELDAGEGSGAKEQFQAMIALDPSSPYGYHHMASYFKSRGDLASAERSMREALERLKTPPRSPRRLVDVLHARHMLAGILIAQGRLDEAESILRRALAESIAGPEWRVLILDRLGGAYLKQGKRKQAEESFRQAAALCETSGSCPCLMPFMPLRKSRRDWMSWVRVAPLVHLSALYADEGRKAQAAESAGTAWKRFPAAERMSATDLNYAVAVGELYSRLGDDVEAARIFRWTLSRRDRMPDKTRLGAVADHLAYLDRKFGLYGEAARLYREEARSARLDGRWADMFRLARLWAESWMRAGLGRIGTP